MNLKIKMKFSILVFGAMGLAVTSLAQEASQRPASELYKNARVDRHTDKPFRQQSVSSAKGAKNLPSAQRIIAPPTPPNKVSQATNYAPRKVSAQQGKKSLPSNSNQSIQKYNKRRQIEKPHVPTPEEGRISG